MQTISSHPTRAAQPCLSPIEIWQRLLTHLLSQHYGLTLNDTPFSDEATICQRFTHAPNPDKV